MYFDIFMVFRFDNKPQNLTPVRFRVVWGGVWDTARAGPGAARRGAIFAFRARLPRVSAHRPAANRGLEEVASYIKAVLHQSLRVLPYQ